ncbi:MAG: LicD family protein [Spirochaetes bacterium]|nr:LicD family protein [Spirochaetota bacterium]
MFIYSGLNISGSISGDKSEGKNIIEIFINDKIIKQIQTKHGLFNIRIFRSTVDLLPKSPELSIRVKDGEYLFYKSSKKAVIEIPHGNGSVFDKLNKGFSLSKKGTFSLTGKEMGERQKCYLENYSKLKLFFEKELGKPLFLIYGTLLGFYRDGDFIPGDDDFDCCYISHETDPVRVKNETRRIVMKLVQSGFTVSFNRTGRLFRIPVGKNRDGAYIDICPVWFKNGNLWTHPLTTVPAGVNDFLPVNTGIFKGTEVFIPKSPEVFLAGYYGPGWKVPDPSYVTDMTKIKSKDIKFLKKAYITPKEYREMDKMLNKTHTHGNGRLVSGSLQDLYPLVDFIF